MRIKTVGKCIILLTILLLSSSCSFLFNKPPTAVIVASPLISPNVPVEVSFDGTKSFDPDGNIIRYDWDFGDGDKATGPVVSHVFDRPGQYTTRLAVTDNHGSRGWTEVVVYVAVTAGVLEQRIKAEFPTHVDASKFSVISPRGSTSLNAEASSTVTLIPAEYQLIAVVNPEGKVVLMRYVYHDELWLKNSLQNTTESLVRLDARSTALSLILLNPIFAGTDGQTRQRIQNEALNHARFPSFVAQVEKALKDNPLNPKYDDALFASANDISVEIYEKVFKPVPKEPETFEWKYEIRKDGPAIAAAKPNDSYLWVVNPKAIYYAVGVCDHDSKNCGNPFVFYVKPADWGFLIFWRSGKTPYNVECKRVHLRISKGTLDILSASKEALYGTVFNTVHLISQIVSLVAPIFVHIDPEKIPELSAEKTIKQIIEITIQIFSGDVKGAIQKFLEFLSEERNAYLVIKLLANINIIMGSAENLAKLASNAAKIAGAVVKALQAIDLIRFAYDLATAPGGGNDSLRVSVQGVQRGSPECLGGQSITVIPQISVLSAMSSEPYANETVTFTCQATDLDGEIVSYYWSFENDTFRLGSAQVQYVFSKPGTYKVRVKVVDNAGAWEIAETVVNVKEKKNLPPIARLQAQPTEGPAPLSVKFDASASYDPDGRIVLYRWVFGDGETAETPGAILQHTYTLAGSFRATLTVIDDQGAQATTQVVITVHPPACPDLTVTKLWVEPEQFTPGQKLTVRFTIKNIGESSSGEFRAVLTLDGREVDSGSLRSLAGGQEIQAYSDILFWPDDKCHTLAVVVDPENAVRECSETNNQMTRSFCPSQPCVNRPSIWTDKTEYCVGDKVNIYITVSAPSYVDVWVAYPDGQVKFLLEDQYLADPGKQYLLTARAGEPLGNRTLYLKAKACGIEVSVWCNVLVKSCAEPSVLPDLTILSVTRLWGRYIVSECYKITISNQGGVASSSTDMIIYYEECPKTAKYVNIPPLRPRESVDFEIEIEFEGKCICCDCFHTIVVSVDPYNKIKESNEGNNVYKRKEHYPCL